MRQEICFYLLYNLKIHLFIICLQTDLNVKKIEMNELIVAMFVHVCWAALLYAGLTVARAPSVWSVGKRADGTNPFASFEPRLSANLSNQFEWPLLFYVACVLLILLNAASSVAVMLAWIFVLGRVVHTLVQVFTTNVRLRGVVFTINFVAVLGLWFLILYSL